MNDNTQLDMFEQVDGKVYFRDPNIREPKGLFILVHFSNSWDMVDGEWLPRLSEVPVIPGVNGVTGYASNPNTDSLLGHIKRKRGIVIDPEDTRLGEFQGFLKRRDNLFAFWKNNNEYSHHYLGCGITDEVYKVVDGKNTVTYRTDGQRYNEFRKLLVTSGIVKPITDECIKGINELKQSVNDMLVSSGRKVVDEQSPPFYSVNHLTAWLDKQKNIHANEQAFFEMLVREGCLVDAACYTLHMSNPPSLEEVMKITGLGKTSIYNRLKTLRATEKVDSCNMEYEIVNIYEVDGKPFTFDSLVNEIEKIARKAYQAAHKIAVEKGDVLLEKERKALLVLSDIFELAENHVTGCEPMRGS